MMCIVFSSIENDTAYLEKEAPGRDRNATPTIRENVAHTGWSTYIAKCLVKFVSSMVSSVSPVLFDFRGVRDNKNILRRVCYYPIRVYVKRFLGGELSSCEVVTSSLSYQPDQNIRTNFVLQPFARMNRMALPRRSPRMLGCIFQQNE